jgi:hypothetical protein
MDKTQQLKEQWIQYEKGKIEKTRKRQYLHFDTRINTVNDISVSNVFNPDYIIRRFFYPLLLDASNQRKIKRNKDGKKIIFTKNRPICYAGHTDSLIFSWYSYILGNLYEDKIKELGIEKNSIAYRSINKNNNIHFAHEVFNFIKQKEDCVAVCFDIKGFFDNLDHKILKSAWIDLLNIDTVQKSLPEDHYAVFKAVTKYSYVNKDDVFKIFDIDESNYHRISKICNLKDFKSKVRASSLIVKNTDKQGIPQGLSISANLSNIYMIEFDKNVSTYINNISGIYRRYSDDIVIVCDRSKYKDAIKYIINQIEKTCKLTIQKEKTEIKFFSKNRRGDVHCKDENGNDSTMQYLGVISDGKVENLRASTISRYVRRITNAVKKESRLSKKNQRKFAKRKIYKKTIHNKNGFRSYAKNAIQILQSKNLKKQMGTNNLVKIVRKRIKKEKTK